MKLAARVSVFIFLSVMTYILVMHYYSGPSWKPTDIINPNSSGHVKDISFVAESTPKSKLNRVQEVVVAVVVCGDRLQETLVMLKSAAFFSKRVPLRIIVITEKELIPNFEETLKDWKVSLNQTVDYEIHEVSFPSNSGDEWRKLFKPCASQRLFLPSVLPHIDSVLYVDTDVLFLSPLEEVWSHFGKMNSSQFAGLAPEHEDPNTGWYNRFARHPYYGELGINSGVMLMNLTRMRMFHWEDYLLPVLKEFKLKITWGDQDIINIIFHYHPECVYLYGCDYNYRSDHCMYMSVCAEAEKSGVKVLHGSRGTFHSQRQPTFKAVFTAFQEFPIGQDPFLYLLMPMESRLKQATASNCGRIYDVFLIGLRNFVKVYDYLK